MKPPTVTTRFMSRPLVAAMLYTGVGLALFGWMHGSVPWWLGIMALCFAGTVRNAVRAIASRTNASTASSRASIAARS